MILWSWTKDWTMVRFSEQATCKNRQAKLEISGDLQPPKVLNQDLQAIQKLELTNWENYITIYEQVF